MTVTAFTSEQLLLFNETSQAYINLTGITGSREVNAILQAMNVVIPSASDEQRTKRFTLEKSTGTIGLVSTAGAYTGTDYEADRVLHEQIFTLTEKGGKSSLARRNTGKLTQFISTLATDSAGAGADAADRFKREGYGQLIEDEMYTDMKTAVITALETALNGADVDTVYGDTVIANSGTVHNIDNLVSGIDLTTNAEDGIEAVVNNLVAQTDAKGNRLQFNQPKFIFTDSAVYTALLKEMKKSQTVNEYDRGLLDFWNNDAIIAPYTATVAKDAFFFTGDLPLKLISETPMPYFFSGVDEDMNYRMHISFIFVFEWKARSGVVKVTAA